MSALCQGIDDRAESFLNRPLEGDWPYLGRDATSLKMRRDGYVVSVAAILAMGVNAEGRREILGVGLGDSEAQVFWTEFLRSPRRRGLAGGRWVI